jgi:hypothetical protein
MDEALLREVDRRKETRERGRSAFIRLEIELYLELDRRMSIDRAHARAYGGRADVLLAQFEDLVTGQQWPEE